MPLEHFVCFAHRVSVFVDFITITLNASAEVCLTFRYMRVCVFVYIQM